MARTQSAMLALGTSAPQFSLDDVRDHATHTTQSLMGPKGLLIMFMCAHCPYVKHVESELAKVGAEYRNSGIGIAAISSNDAEAYPGDAPAALAAQAHRLGFTFPYLFDETQEVAKAYGAACTPDFFLFDTEGKLVYRGQFDDSRPNSGIPVTGKDLRAALDALAAGRSLPDEQRPSLGCNIKWRED